jgi:ATP-binding cassette subfamily C protein
MTVILGAGPDIAITWWKMPIAELAVVAMLLQKTTNNYTKTQCKYQKAVSIERPYLEIKDLINEVAKSPEPNPGTQAATLEQHMSLDQISFSYGDTRILSDLSLTIELGKITVLTGPYGAGKTTLADILIGLTVPDEWHVLLDGVPL